MENRVIRRSPLLTAAGFRHAFFTRHGGVSSGPYASLNFSSSVGDAPANVAANLARAGDLLGVKSSHIYFLSQVHGRDVVAVDGSEPRESVLYREGDAIVSGSPGVACGVRTADCVPILLADRATGAVAAVHAGWRGVVAGVVTAGLQALAARAERNDGVLAAIGPHISIEAFEVSEEVAQLLLEHSPVPDVVRHTSGVRPHVDLRRIVRGQLEAGGLPSQCIDDVAGCTFGDPESFFSYRRDGPKSGRHLAAIVARDN